MDVLLSTILIFLSLSYVDTKSVPSNRDKVPGRNPSNRDKVPGRNPSDMRSLNQAFDALLPTVIKIINEGTKFIQTPNFTVSYFDTKSTSSNSDKVPDLDPTSVSSVRSAIQDLLTIFTRQTNASDRSTETQSTNDGSYRLFTKTLLTPCSQIDADRTLHNSLDIDENDDVGEVEKRAVLIILIEDDINVLLKFNGN